MDVGLRAVCSCFEASLRGARSGFVLEAGWCTVGAGVFWLLLAYGGIAGCDLRWQRSLCEGVDSAGMVVVAWVH